MTLHQLHRAPFKQNTNSKRFDLLFHINTAFVFQEWKVSAWKQAWMGYPSPLWWLLHYGITSARRPCLSLNWTHSTLLTAGSLSLASSLTMLPPPRLIPWRSLLWGTWAWPGQRLRCLLLCWLLPPWETALCCGCCWGGGNTTRPCMCSWWTCVWLTWWWASFRSVLV